MLDCSFIRHPPSQGNVATGRLGTHPSTSTWACGSQYYPHVVLSLCWCHEISPPLEGTLNVSHFDNVVNRIDVVARIRH